MAILKYLKNRKTKNTGRQISILPVNKYKNILLVNVKNLAEISSKIKADFINGQLISLETRAQKEDNSSMHSFSYHKSDKKLGRIKNERLINLQHQNFDLIIYFNKVSIDLINITKPIKSTLIIGPSDSEFNYMFDILISESSNELDYTKNIVNQLNILKHD